MNNLISIIIPTYNRTKYLTRALHYWSAYPVDIIVVDGSKKPSMSSELFHLFGSVQYYHLPISVEKRLSFAASKLITKYAVLSSDDDFLSYSSLVESVNILESQNEVSAVIGETLGFVTLGKEFLLKSHYKDASNLDISSTEPIERYEQRKKAVDSIIFYSLVRSETLKLTCSFVAENEYSCPYIAELQVEAMFCAAGKVVVIPMVMLYRNFGVESISTKQHNRKILFTDWVSDPINSIQIEKLMVSASIYFNKALKSSNPLTGAKFIELNANKYEEDLLQKQNYFYLKLRELYFLSPASFKILVRKVLIGIFGQTPSKLLPISKMLSALDNSNIRYNIAEINRIQNLTLPSK